METVKVGNSEMRLKSTVRFVESKPLFPEEVKLINFLRGMGYGELTIKVKDGLPVMGHHPVEDIKFTTDDST